MTRISHALTLNVKDSNEIVTVRARKDTLSGEYFAYISMSKYLNSEAEAHVIKDARRGTIVSTKSPDGKEIVFWRNSFGIGAKSRKRLIREIRRKVLETLHPEIKDVSRKIPNGGGR